MLSQKEERPCSICHEGLPDEELTSFDNGDLVCRDCLADYLEDRGRELVDRYVEENMREYLKNWWWKNDLSSTEKLHIMEESYLWYKLLSPERLANDRAEFCASREDWHLYIKEQLCSGEGM